MLRVTVARTGGVEVLELEQADTPVPAAGEVLIRHTAIGVNFIDVYFRSGLYQPPNLPFTPGAEAAGVIEAVGDGVHDLSQGMRVAYAGGQLGAYAQLRTIAADRVVPLPSSIPDEVAAAGLLKGLTAEYLLRRTFPVSAGQTILVHAAAGGVGSLLCQWARHLGVRVIGTVGSREKLALAKRWGAEEVILYREESTSARVRELTGGVGVPVVYDSVGKDTFSDSLDCLATRGTLVSYGQSSGKVPAFDITELSQKGSLYVTRPTLWNYTAQRSELLSAAQALFEVLESGAVEVHVGQRYPLQQVAQAHSDLEARQTTGSSVLLPGGQ